MSDLTPNQWTILESLTLGAVWTRSLQPVKPLLHDLIERGMVERCKPFLGRGSNMVRLTASGCALLQIDTSSVPAFRDRPLKVCTPEPKPNKSNRTAEAKALLADVEGWCAKTGTPETTIGHKLFLHPGFVGLLRKRLTVSPEKEEAVRNFLTEHPFGWSGTLPLTHANGTRPAYRASSPKARQRIAEETRLAAMPVIDRTPCSRCGIRADIGCKHQTRAA